MSVSYREELYNHYVSARSSSGLSDTEFLLNVERRKPFLNQVIKKYFPRNLKARIVELGCGSGSLLYFAKKAGYQDLFGCDVSKEQVDLSKKIGLTEIVMQDAMSAIRSFADQSIDVVVSFDVIEHMTKTESLALSREVFRTLKPNGKWIIHTVNAESPFFGRIRYGDFTHEMAFTKESIKQLFGVAGFKDVACYEDEPPCHGLKSFIRYLLWKVVRSIFRIVLAAETGEKNGIFSQNFLVVAVRRGE